MLVVSPWQGVPGVRIEELLVKARSLALPFRSSRFTLSRPHVRMPWGMCPRLRSRAAMSIATWFSQAAPCLPQAYPELADAAGGELAAALAGTLAGLAAAAFEEARQALFAEGADARKRCREALGASPVST